MKRLGAAVRAAPFESGDLAEEHPLSVELTDIISLSGFLEYSDSPVASAKESSASATSKISKTGISSDVAIARMHCENENEGLQQTKRPRKQQHRTSHVHNISEKRRRDRIESRMKVLRELIPNSQKLDKASLLDRAICHMKTLKRQLQVMQQMRQLLMCPLVPQPTTSTMGLMPGINTDLSAFYSPFLPPFQQPFLPLNTYSYSDWLAAFSTFMQAIPGDHSSVMSNQQPIYHQA